MKNGVIALMACAVLYLGVSTCYNTFFRASEEIPTQVVVKLGDTMYGICNDTYITENNAESFNEFFDKNLKRNGAEIFAGQTVEIVNRVWK